MFRRCIILAMVVCVLVAVPSYALAWKFASIADSRGDTNGVNVAVLTTIVNRINAGNVDFVLFQGDAVSGSTDDNALSSQMDTWLGVMNTLNCPWYFTPGNHEINTPTAQENVLRAKVNQPLNGPPSDLEMVFSFDHQNAHFVALNSNHYGEVHRVQRSWLATDLANCVQPHIFVMAHEPAYPCGPHAGSSLDVYPAERDEFWSIMSFYGVGMFFCGHEHLYQRKTYGSIQQIINGTCGAPIHTGYPGTIAQYHYVIVTVDGNNVSAVCRNDAGNVLDTWSYAVTPPTDVTCGGARLLPDGTYVTLRNKVVTHVRGSAISVEEDDRSAAFRATGMSGVAAGDRVNIVGTLQTNSSGEREIQGSAMKLSSGNTLPKPVVLTNKALLGASLGYNPGADGGVGCNNSSMLVQITGTVTKVGTGANAGMFYIDDGSGVTDGTIWGGSANKGVRVVWQGSVSLGQHRVVNGICSSFVDGGKIRRLVYCTDKVVLNTWSAYNDVVYSSAPAYANPPLMPNVTTINIGSGSPGPSSGVLKDFPTGIEVGVTATLTQSGGVVWQPDGSSPNYSGGADCDPGTDARNTFSSITASLVGVVYYGSSGWYVDLTFTGLDPARRYEFVTSANRHKTDGSYSGRITKYTISSADAFTNTSTSGVTIGDGGASSSFCTGYNTVNGYVARWTQIAPGADGSFKVRAEAGSAEYRAYAFSAFKLRQLP